MLTLVLLRLRASFALSRQRVPVQVMRRIVDDTWQITYPPYLSPAAKDLIARLLERRPARRIGAQAVNLGSCHATYKYLAALQHLFADLPELH